MRRDVRCGLGGVLAVGAQRGCCALLLCVGACEGVRISHARVRANECVYVSTQLRCQ